MKITDHSMSRRRFLVHSAFTASPISLVPGRVLGLDGNLPPSEKLHLEGVGIGGQGADDLDKMRSEDIVALCDVDASYAARTFKKYPQARQWAVVSR